MLDYNDYFGKTEKIEEKSYNCIDTDNRENWVLYILDSIEQISKKNYKFYSQDLLNNLFKQPYTKIEFIENDVGVSGNSPIKYLNLLAKDEV